MELSRKQPCSAVNLARSNQEAVQDLEQRALVKPRSNQTDMRANSETVVKVRKPERMYGKFGYDIKYMFHIVHSFFYLLKQCFQNMHQQ